MNTDLDALLRESDPADRMAIPSTGSPEFEQIWASINSEGSQLVARQRRQTRRILFPALSLGLVVAIVLLITQLLPTAGFRPASSAAATLRSLAQVADAQSSVVPSSSQWLEQKVEVSFNASILSVGTTSTPNASATINANIDEWSNTKSTTCTESTFSAARFASPANQQAWADAGLLVNPSSPSVSCTTVNEPQSSAVGGGSGVFDISSLPTDPKKLAQELEEGTTGIPDLDQLPSLQTGANPDFARAVAILVGPTVGASPSFWSALLNAMATMKGVSSLGTVTTHSGSTGLGFTAQAGLGQITIVLSPSMGALLEARNFQDPALQGSAQAFVERADPHGIASEGGSSKIVVDWLDPITSPTVVDSLPNSVQRQLPPTSTATGLIQAETKARVMGSQLVSLARQLRQLPGEPVPAFSSFESFETPSVWIFTVTMHGTSGDEHRVEAVMRHTGLFAYVQQNAG
jgi:hypothetical protein